MLFATSNPHKVEEVQAILSPLGIELHGLDTLDELPAEPEETGATFEDNARLKAVYYARATGQRCLADDSGLEVDALDGAPGVHSARYARDEHGEAFDVAARAQRDQWNNRKLLRALSGVPAERRSARFVCVMCLADPQGTVVATTRGSFEGVIAEAPRGENGFGYDPLLIVAGDHRTSAELPPEEKNALSHRGAAARRMAREIG